MSLSILPNVLRLAQKAFLLALVFTCLQYRSLENTGGKGEIAHNEQFLLFPVCSTRFMITFCHFDQI